MVSFIYFLELSVYVSVYVSVLQGYSGGTTGGLEGTRLPKSQRSAKLLKKNGIKLAGYTFRLKNYVKIPPSTFFGYFKAGAATAGFPWVPDPGYGKGILL